MQIHDSIKLFAAMLETQLRERFTQEYPGAYLEERRNAACTVTIHHGKKFARVDVGSSGRYMVDLATGEIYGIKGYGVVHRGHRYGTLDTTDRYHWGAYRAVPRAKEAA